MPNDYEPGQTVFIKQITRPGSKLYKKETLKENRQTFVITEAGRVAHKSNIKPE